MVRDDDDPAYKFKKILLVYWLPSHAIAEAFPVIVGAYITLLSVLRDLAAGDSQDELSMETLFEQPGFEDQFYNYTDNFTGSTEETFGDNYTISVSNAVLWVCRKGSPDGGFYRTLYQMAIAFLIIFHLGTGFSQFCTAKFWYAYETSESGNTTTITRYDKDPGIIVITIVGAVFLNLAFLLLLLSFDISPWSCISRPSTVHVDYISFSNRFDIQIQHSPSAITFQKVASILSFVLSICWVIVRVVFFCCDCVNNNLDERMDSFKDAPDIGSTNQDNELLEVNVATEEYDS